MKYAIIILSGAADEALPELGNRTPLQAAHMPHVQSLARRGRVGAVVTVPEGFEPSSEHCLLTLLGHDLLRTPCGRAALEAEALGVDAGAGFVFRLDLVTIGDAGTSDAGLLLDHAGGAIPRIEADVLLDDLLAYWRRESGDLVHAMEITRLPAHAALMVDRSGRDFAEVLTVAPRSIVGQEASSHLPGGGAPGAADALRQLIESSYDLLSRHEVNLARVEQGLRPANLAWFWGHGRRLQLDSMQRRFGVSAAAIGSSLVFRGLARAGGWNLQLPAGDRAATACQACDLLQSHDLVLVCDDAPDHASHAGDWQAKTESLEEIDAELIGPIVQRLAAFGDAEREPDAIGWRAMVVVDHATPVRTRQHTPGPVPVVLAGSWIRSAVERSFCESQADTSDMHVDPGHELLEFFLRGGLARVRKELRS
ncbi:MAG: hypothetical protein KJZ65_10235 [Phycisphaerales bacterium]|nr:hypothetical protein [Phycisphaerales bacterium]